MERKISQFAGLQMYYLKTLNSQKRHSEEKGKQNYVYVGESVLRDKKYKGEERKFSSSATWNIIKYLTMSAGSSFPPEINLQTLLFNI